MTKLTAFLNMGGPAMWVIAGLSVATLALILWKLWRLWRMGVWRRQHAVRAVQLWQNGESDGALGMVKSRRGARGRVVRAAMKALTEHPQHTAREETARVARGVMGEAREGLRALELIMTIAPLVGLLGTVLGMIETFDVISVFGTGNARAMAGGISVALVTTQSGLIIAIPGLFISGALARRARRLENRLDEVAVILDRHIKLGGPAPSAEVEAT